MGKLFRIHVEKADKLDPVVNIALGARLLGHKFSQIKKANQRNSKTMIAHYNSRGDAGVAYARKVFDLYEKSKKSR